MYLIIIIIIIIIIIPKYVKLHSEIYVNKMLWYKS